MTVRVLAEQSGDWAVAGPLLGDFQRVANVP